MVLRLQATVLVNGDPTAWIGAWRSWLKGRGESCDGLIDPRPAYGGVPAQVRIDGRVHTSLNVDTWMDSFTLWLRPRGDTAHTLHVLQVDRPTPTALSAGNAG